jgi:RHS repeat-associated protein
VGERGPEAMPGTLPATTSYTYAVELSVDEADAIGAHSVVFDRPVGFYLENFLDFPVGTVVPLGYYDRAKAAWIAADSGVVLGIVAHSGGLAAIDLDGDGAAENDAVLAAAGITAEERAGLVTLYEPGQTLWRVSIPHFTPWDCNWAYIPPLDAIFPDEDFVRDPDRDQPCPRSGSVIQCERQSLSQFVDVPGTHVTLAYHGDRKPGWDADRDLELQVSGADLPASMTGIVLETDIAGQRITQEMDPSSEQRATISWDGRDGYGRIMQGVQHARVRLGYSYQPVYAMQGRFGGWGRGPITNSVGRALTTLWAEATVMFGNWDATPQGLGGFGIASHHGYDPESGTLFLGDGTRRSARNVAPVLTKLDKPPLAGWVSSIVEAADGTVYVGTSAGDIGYIPPNGRPTLYSRVATAVNDMAVAPDGTLYATDVGRRRIVAIAPEQDVRVVAGGGSDPFLQSGGAARLATEVALSVPTGLALAPDGGLYIVDHGNHRVLRHVDPSGMLTTIGLEGLQSPWDVELGPDGSLYIALLHFGGRGLYRMYPDGRVEAVIGADENIVVSGVSVRADGTVLVADGASSRILRVNENGTYTALAGGGPRVLAPGEISTAVAIPTLQRGAIDTQGRILFTDGFGVYRVDPSVPGVSSTDIVVPSGDGSELYVFDQTGRHLETRDALTGVTLLAFAYDDAGRVIRMTDRDQLATHIERDATGLGRAIVGPYGQRSALFYDEQDQLARVEDPLQRQVSFGYDQAGRMVSMRDARDGLHRFEYDPRGRLVRDIGPTDYTQTLAPADDTPNGGNVMVTTSLMRGTRYQVQRASNDVSVRTMELPSGRQGTVAKYPTRTELAAPDGTSTSFTLASDARWHTQAPWAREARVVTPMGRTFVTTSEREVGFADPAHPHQISSMLQRYTVAGRTSTVRYDAATRTTTGQSPTGRQRTVTRDDRGRVVRVDQAGTAPYIVAYDAHGRVASVQRGEGAGARVTLLHYDANGNLAQRIDPLGRPHYYEHDLIGRLRASTGPDGQRIELDYDAHDNITRVKPPGRPAHELRYTAADQAERYIPPALAGVDAEVAFHYDADLAPAAADGPGGQQVSFQRDYAGRVQSIALARGYYGHGYDPETGHLVYATSPDAVDLHYDRDGALLRETRWNIPGAADVTVGLDYDDAFRPRALTVQGSSPIEHGYDADDALIQAGPLTIVRDPQTGLPDTTQAGSLETDLDVSAFGEPEQFSASFAGQSLYQAVYERDAIGRITRVDEMIDGQSRSVAYGYDDGDRLAFVDELGQPARELLHDANGNLVEMREDGVPVLTATHDAQDRVLTHGRFALTHSDSGHLASKLDMLSGQSTAYQYDEFGNLLGVDLADGRSIQYLIDGADRRVARLVDGALQWLFVYAGGLPVARLFPDGSVESIYVYGALAHVPDLVLKAGGTYRIVHDHLGSPRLVVDVQTGEIAQRLDYDIHGRVLGDSSPDFQPFGFAGGLYDVDTGLVRFGARDYDAELGRWTAKDPSGFAGGDTNLYAYSYGDSVNFVDPNGELAFLVPLIIAIGKGALAGAAIGGGMALGVELIENGGDIGCVDWGGVGGGVVEGGILGGATGGLLHGLGRAYSALKHFRSAARGIDKGLAGRGFRPPPGTRVRPKGVPEGWRIRGTKGEGGVRYIDPQNPHNSVRVMPGTPSSPYPNSQNPYVRWHRDGQSLGVNGSPVPKNSPEAHIPLDEFIYKP